RRARGRIEPGPAALRAHAAQVESTRWRASGRLPAVAGSARRGALDGERPPRRRARPESSRGGGRMGRKAGTRDARRAAVRPRWPSGAAAHAVGEDRGSARTQLLDRMNGGPRAERVASLAKALDRDRRDVLPKGGWPYPVPIDHPWFVL